MLFEENQFFQKADELVKELCDFKTVKRCDPITGGLVNKACSYQTDRGVYFAKYAIRENAKTMFESEMESLKLLQDLRIIRMPQPYKVIEVKGHGALLLMEFIEGLENMTSQWKQLGEKMARVHAHNKKQLDKAKKEESSIHAASDGPKPVDKFGFPFPSYYGPNFSTPGVWCDTWEEFYARYQLKPQFDIIEQTTGDRDFRELWSQLEVNLGKFQNPDLTPCLLHGDLCQINVGEANNDPILFDPCSLYGPAECDFTIPEMEKNFPPEFFEAYHSIIPKGPAFDLRLSASLAFAYPLVYNMPGQDEITKEEALAMCKKFLKNLEDL